MLLYPGKIVYWRKTMISFVLFLSNVIFCNVPLIFVSLRHEIMAAGRKVFYQLSIPVTWLRVYWIYKRPRFCIFCAHQAQGRYKENNIFQIILFMTLQQWLNEVCSELGCYVIKLRMCLVYHVGFNILTHQIQCTIDCTNVINLYGKLFDVACFWIVHACI